MDECKSNPTYMLVNCATSCAKVLQQQKAQKSKLESLKSFYDLTANDIDGDAIDFAQFKSKVVVVVNVASYCGYTDSHYKGLVDLWNDIRGESDKLEILAFPWCVQEVSKRPWSIDCHTAHISYPQFSATSSGSRSREPPMR